MTHVDQGILKRIIKEYKDVKNSYKECIKDYSNDWDFGNVDSPVLWFFIDWFNSIFVNAKNLKIEIENMLETIKLENKKNKEKYEEMSEECQEIVEDIKEKFDDMLQIYGELIDNGKAFIERLEIYK